MERLSKFRVGDDWINCEMAYLKKRMKFDDSDAVLTTETSVPILFALLEEIKERRGATQTDGVAMERVSNEWLDEAIPKYSAIDSKSKGANVYLALCELRERRQMEDEQGELVVASTFMAIKTAEILQLLKKAEKEHGHTDSSEGKKDGAGAMQEKAVLPIPCTKGFENWTVKQWFAKINEELDELKEAVGSPMLATPRELYSVTWSDFSDRAIEERCKKIAEEAADTITAITSMLEAIGIDEQQRQAAQRRVNEHNRERNRL